METTKTCIGLYDYQLEAIKKLHNGSILCGDVGSGKSRTALGYYFKENGGDLYSEEYVPMNDPPRDLYIITTARKRDTMEWELDMAPFLLSSYSETNLYSNKVVVDSWNNIKKYEKVYGAFFIFDEQRVVGSGAWVKAFYKIARKNKWILLTATPGDQWKDYIPVFVANGYYKNKTDFLSQHAVYNMYTKYPQIVRYVGIGKLIRERSEVLVRMEDQRHTERHYEEVLCDHDRIAYNRIFKDRWNIYEEVPIKNASECCYLLRKLINSDPSRSDCIKRLTEEHPKAIIFYNFDYELEILRNLKYVDGTEIAEWNGHVHQPIPKTERWVYLVQYTAGAEGWNCVETDTIIFYSQNYSYRITSQAEGRIDRLNTPYKDLFYYILKSNAPIDNAIKMSLKRKENFNESAFINLIS